MSTIVNPDAPPALPSDHVSVVVHAVEGYGEYEAFARAAAARLEQVINSPGFKELVIAGGYNRREGLAPAQVYERIIRAHEVLGSGGADGVVDLRLRTMNPQDDCQRWMSNCEIGSRASTIGKDGGTSGMVTTCPQRIAVWARNNDVSALAGYFMHEYMHQLGFSHRGLWKRRSAVYKVGGFAEKVAAGM